MLDGKLKISSRVNYIKSNINNEPSQWESFDNPYRHLYRLPRNIRTEDASNFEYTDSSGNFRQNYWKPNDNGGQNPYWTINRANLSETLTDRVLGHTSLTYNISDDLNILVRSAIDNSTNSFEKILVHEAELFFTGKPVSASTIPTA